MNDKSENYIERFQQTIKSDALDQFTGTLTESLIDSALDDGLIKDLPLASIFIGAIKLKSRLRERDYLIKLANFLYEIKDIPQSEREKFVNGIIKDPKYFYGKILIFIDRLNELEKATIAGRLFNSLISSRINRDDYFRLSAILERIYYGDLKYLEFRYIEPSTMSENERNEYYRSIDEEVIRTSLTNEGILQMKEFEDHYATKRTGSITIRKRYNLTTIGNKLIDSGIKKY